MSTRISIRDAETKDELVWLELFQDEVSLETVWPSFDNYKPIEIMGQKYVVDRHNFYSHYNELVVDVRQISDKGEVCESRK